MKTEGAPSFEPILPENKKTDTIEKPRSVENEPVTKNQAIEALKTKGPQDAEALSLLQKYCDRYEAEYRGPLNIRLECIKEKANVLAKAEHFAEAILAMQDALEFAQNENDRESEDEALWIIGRIQARLDEQIQLNEQKIVKTEEVAPTLESTEKISREQAMEAFKEFSGAGDPAALDENDPGVVEANKLFESWDSQREEETRGDADATMAHNFEKTMFYVDAGFHDKTYLGDVLEWLGQDAMEAEKDLSNFSGVKLRSDIGNAMKKIRGLLSS